MTRDELIAARMDAARKFARGIDDIDWGAVRARIAESVDSAMIVSQQIRDQSQPEREDTLKECGRDYPARLSHACGGGRRVIRDGRTQS